MLTRRAVLTGTAAASIAAIANARGVEAAPPAIQAGFGGCGYGSVTGGAIAVFEKHGPFDKDGPFDKQRPGFGAFVKFDETSVDMVFKESFDKDTVAVFFKVFSKDSWSESSHTFDKLTSMDKAHAYFAKVGPDLAHFFVEDENEVQAFVKISVNTDGVHFEIGDVAPDID